MSEQPFFRFKHVRAGAPVHAGDLPKLPPRAVSVILNKFKDAGLSPQMDVSKPEVAAILSDLATDLVFLTLRRIEPTLTLAQVAEDEDFEEVLACFTAVQAANPKLFPKAGPVRPAADPTTPR